MHVHVVEEHLVGEPLGEAEFVENGRELDLAIGHEVGPELGPLPRVVEARAADDELVGHVLDAVPRPVQARDGRQIRQLRHRCARGLEPNLQDRKQSWSVFLPPSLSQHLASSFGFLLAFERF